MPKKPFRLAALAGASLLLSAFGIPAAAADPAESARIRELEKKLERSMQMIEELSGKVRQLEQANAGNSGSAQNARIDELQKQVGDLTTANSRRGSDDGLPVHGFADVGLRHSNENNAAYGKGTKGFAVGSFDLYLTPQFGDRVKTLVELLFEVDRDGGLETDLERAQIGYTVGDSLVAWLGRFHTPFGYWNTAFHHGQQIQTSPIRPRFLDFEDAGGILPAHTTGIWLTGSLPFAGNKFGYDAYVGNAPRIHDIDPATGRGTLNMKMSGSDRFFPTAGFNVSLRPGSLPDLTLGLHGQRGRIRDDLGNETRLNMFGGYGVFNNDKWEVMSEYYRFRNRDLSGNTGTHGSSAWYAQAGYNLGTYTPYARFEKTRLDQTDNYFLAQASGRSYRRTALGLRYDVNNTAAIKLELNRTRQGDLGLNVADDNYTEARFQYAIRF